jgi:hypothetical protein
VTLQVFDHFDCRSELLLKLFEVMLVEEFTLFGLEMVRLLGLNVAILAGLLDTTVEVRRVRSVLEDLIVLGRGRNLAFIASCIVGLLELVFLGTHTVE